MALLLNFQQSTNILCVGAISRDPGSDARFVMRRVAFDQELLKVIAGFSKPGALSGHQLVTAEELHLLTVRWFSPAAGRGGGKARTRAALLHWLCVRKP